MTKIKTLLVFFALVFGFCASASSVCTPEECEEFKDTALGYISTIDDSLVDIYNLAGDGNALAIGGNNPAAIREALSGIQNSSTSASSTGNQLYHFIDRVDCNSCSNGTCSVDLYPVVSALSNIVSVLEFQRYYLYNISENSNLIRSTLDSFRNNFTSTIYLEDNYAYQRVYDPKTLSAISNLVYNLNLNHLSTTNALRLIRNAVYDINDNTSSILSTLEDVNSYMGYFVDIVDLLTDIDALMIQWGNWVQGTYVELKRYLHYLETISYDLKLISTNGVVSIDQSYTNLFHYSNLLGFDRFRYYAQGQLNNTQVSLYPLSPYDNLQNLRNATIYDAVAAGFESLLISQGSINNYLYWLKAVAGSNRLESVENHILAVSNLVGRLDNYVLNDFSNEIVKISNNLSYLTNRVDYTTNFVHLVELVETNNSFLASIDSKLDVLDYIKILSTTPLSSYSGDVDYYDYLTNLYINGSADSGGVSTNWFERMEILLASLVFGDSDGTNDIPQSVEMEGVDSSAVQSALTDFTYNQEFTGAITALDDTRQSFIGVLNGLHTSIKSVSLPASISIGLGGLDGEDTHNFEDMMHGHFQVSFNTGFADRFTIAVRAVTTISWVLLFFLALWKSGFYLIRKLVYFYRLVTRLLVSVFTR